MPPPRDFWMSKPAERGPRTERPETGNAFVGIEVWPLTCCLSPIELVCKPSSDPRRRPSLRFAGVDRGVRGTPEDPISIRVGVDAAAAGQ